MTGLYERPCSLSKLIHPVLRCFNSLLSAYRLNNFSHRCRGYIVKHCGRVRCNRMVNSILLILVDLPAFKVGCTAYALLEVY